jgi:hypothetical protein
MKEIVVARWGDFLDLSGTFVRELYFATFCSTKWAC